MTVGRQRAAAHPRPPIEHAVRDEHAVLARRPHGGDVLGLVGLGFDPDGALRRAIENTVQAPRGPRAGPPHGQLGQHRSVIGELAAGLFRARRVETVVAEHQLQVAVFLLPEQRAVFGRSDHQAAPLRPGKEDPVLVALDVRGCGVARDVMLGRAVGPDGVEQILGRRLPEDLAGAGVQAAERLVGDVEEQAVADSGTRRGCR